MKCSNLGLTDRILRVVLGITLIGGGFYNLPNTFGSVMAFVGLIPLMTGFVGTCPLYSLFNINTHSSKSACTLDMKR